MACSRPIDIFCKETSHGYLVPCGRCEECLHRKKMSFVHRCEQEKLHGKFAHCYFVTLTYKDAFLPYESFSTKKNGAPVSPDSTGEAVLCPYDLSLFFHRYRNFSEDSIRYFACGEYGDPKLTHRPHYHIILFTNSPWKECVNNCNLAWSYLVAESKEQRAERYKLQRKLKRPIKRDSRSMLNRVSIGRVQVTSVTYKRICYVAKYVNKILFSDEPIKPFYRISNGLGDGFLSTETAKLCSVQNRHYTYFQNGLPVALSRFYSRRLFTAQQMIDYQLDIIREEDCPEQIFLSGGFRLWWIAKSRELERQRRFTRVSHSGLLKFYGK